MNHYKSNIVFDGPDVREAIPFKLLPLNKFSLSTQYKSMLDHKNVPKLK